MQLYFVQKIKSDPNKIKKRGLINFDEFNQRQMCAT